MTLASPRRSRPHSSNPLKYFKHMTDFCFYKALTIHQLIQFRTPALPYYADRHSLTVLSGGIRPAALNALQDYTLRRKAKESRPQSRRRCCCHSCCWLRASTSASCLRALQALLPWQPGDDRSHKCTSHVHRERQREDCLLLPSVAQQEWARGRGDSSFGPVGRHSAVQHLQKLKCTPWIALVKRNAFQGVLSVLSYREISATWAMQCIVTYTHTQHALLDWTLFPSLSFSPSFCLQSSTLYQYLKCNLSPPFQSEWLLWRLHWKVAGLVKQKLPLKSYFYRSKLNFVSNVFYLINGTKEAKILAIVLRWQGHWVTVYNVVFDHLQ